MKKAVYIFLFFALPLQAQQAVQYTQYMLNDMGFNPAAAGDNRDYEILAGERKQWYSFDNAPITRFVSVNKGFYKRPYRNFWHGAGVYIEEDLNGLMTTKTVYPIYAFHLVTAKKGYLTLGISPAIRFQGIDPSIYDPMDPALNVYPPKLTMFPDMSAGLRFHYKKLTLDLAGKQLYKNKVVQGDKSLGGPMKLYPHLYFTASRKIFSKAYDYVFEPSLQLRYDFISPLSVSFTCMMFTGKHLGLGLAYRWGDAVSAILQVKFSKNLIIGLAYDYTVSRFRVTGANSFEIMAGMTPARFLDQVDDDRKSGAFCPTWDF
ncbi:MAG TPA: PorP/SprF family type IX secretion system membrane protein [Bacteroidia bacterium]